jgi:hypothetical protein
MTAIALYTDQPTASICLQLRAALIEWALHGACGGLAALVPLFQQRRLPCITTCCRQIAGRCSCPGLASCSAWTQGNPQLLGQQQDNCPSGCRVEFASLGVKEQTCYEWRIVRLPVQEVCQVCCRC